MGDAVSVSLHLLSSSTLGIKKTHLLRAGGLKTCKQRELLPWLGLAQRGNRSRGGLGRGVGDYESEVQRRWQGVAWPGAGPLACTPPTEAVARE